MGDYCGIVFFVNNYVFCKINNACVIMGLYGSNTK